MISIQYANNTYLFLFVLLVIVFSCFVFRFAIVFKIYSFIFWICNFVFKILIYFAFHIEYTLQWVIIYYLTTVSPVYSEDSVVHQKAASLNLPVHYQTDSVLSGVRGLISELKSEQHNLHL